MSELKVSIITPVKVEHVAQLEWLGEAIESVKAQTVDSWEMVIVNDHSAMSWKPLGELFGDPRLRGMKARKEGVSKARNQAAVEARAPLLLPLDGDDRLAPNAVERFLWAWENGGSKRGFVYSDITMFGRDFERYYRAPEYDFGTLLRSTFVCVGCLHRKSDWERMGGWSADFEAGLEDWEYWIRFGENGVCGHPIHEPLYEYRRHAIGRLANIRNEPDRWQIALARMREAHKETYSGKWPKMCCGGQRNRTARPKRAVARIGEESLPSGDAVMMVYKGTRNGSFGITGRPSGRHYRILPGQPFAVASGDVHHLRQFNFGQDFAEVQ